MKRIYLGFIFLFSILCPIIAQEYVVNINCYLKADDHNIEGKAFYVLTFYNEKNEKVHEHRRTITTYYGDKTWNTYNKLVFPIEKAFSRVRLYVEHWDSTTSGDKLRGTKETFHNTPFSTMYPCGSYDSGYTNLIGKDDDGSRMTINIQPYSDMYKLDMELRGSSYGRVSGITFKYLDKSTLTSSFFETVYIPVQNQPIEEISVRYRPYILDRDTVYIRKLNPAIFRNDTVWILQTGRNVLKVNFTYKGFTPLKQEDKSGYLPIGDITTVSSGEFHNRFTWQYSKDHINWLPLPTSFGTASDVVLSGEGVLGNNAIDYIGSNVYFRGIYPCPSVNTKTADIPLTVTLSAPHIESVKPILETCNNAGDGQLLLKFDRKLYPNENLYIAFKDSISGKLNIREEITIAEDSTVLLSNLLAGKYDIGLYGTYKYGANREDTINTYTQGKKHSYHVILPQRPKVTYQIGETPVHCNDGRDGRIWVEAKGGVGKYDAYLFAKGNMQDTLQHIVLKEDIRDYFTELKTGDYVVHLRDTNFCEPIHPDLFEQEIKVTQPVKPVRIYDFKYQEPTGYGRANGEAWANIVGGTGNYTIVWKDSADMARVLVPEPLEVIGDSRRTLLKGLKKGKYYLYVYDDNYPLVNPATEENQCGCTAIDSIAVDQPPMLLVDIAERHYVTCHGDNDGILVAHGIGGRPYKPGDNKSFPYDYQWYKVSKEGAIEHTYNVNDSILTDLYSGYYKVNITDRNKIDTTSLIFNLVQPDPLVVTVKTNQHLLCDGDNIGEVEAVVTGGTPPYQYFWETGETTPLISGLSRGIYSVFVRDARYQDSQVHFCSVQGHAEIKSPNGMEVGATIKEPTCNAYSDGEIALSVIGGVAPYTYLWEDGSTNRDRTGLTKGTFKVTITDANGCSLSEEYTLEEPEPLIVNIGQDFTLCKNQTISIDGTMDFAGMQYQWTKNNTPISTEAIYDINSAGTYKLAVTSTIGCKAESEIKVAQSDDELVTDFVVASRIPNNVKVYAVNIIRTGYDRVEWILPDEAQVWEQTDDRVQFSISQNGSYTVGLIGNKGLCKDILYKTIEVVDKGEIEDFDESEPFLKRFIVTPNPNDGNFKVSVELAAVTNYTLLLYDNNGTLVESKKITNSLGEDTSFNNSNLGTGVYYLRFVSKEITSVFKIIIN
ncbi:T9SS type A sorting domain-containing protein [Dysgonomonas sp. 511]|uniref:T9SS type A sorting domain-containing protein n=1 Tax=Dysgonomonas sp. 511 TaxID=2302930 RepID=UPI0013D42BB2|nr:T9SS type A sorting domain-containing protein [Dysgonomonas sp. 511]NDV79490.1 T9SS C-terminal target domain-containing protein [Dysgonomonas sp. 511]